MMTVFYFTVSHRGSISKGKKKRKKKKKKKRKPQLDENGNPIPRQPKPQNSFPSDESLKNREKEKQEL